MSSQIVYTCGAFDLFHVGHLNILQKAKGLGDKLIVAVSTDELVEEYKKSKPIVPFSERMAIVSAIKYVDVCIPQITRDKLSVWNKIRYDILVLGDDWYDNEFYMIQKEQLEKLNVRTYFLPHTEHISSTKLKQLIKNVPIGS